MKAPKLNWCIILTFVVQDEDRPVDEDEDEDDDFIVDEEGRPLKRDKVRRISDDPAHPRLSIHDVGANPLW